MTSPTVPVPAFFDGPNGPLFGIYHGRAEAPHPAGMILFLPPFAEEMNRSRRTVSRLAQTLAQHYDLGLFSLDPSGTGDSGGDLADASWPAWIEDGLAAVAAIAAQGIPLAGVMGLRIGAALALEIAARVPVPRVVLWQPVLRGEVLLTQLVRQKIASTLGQSGQGSRAPTSQDLHAQLRAGTPLEVGGYILPPALAADLALVASEPLLEATAAPIDWIETGSAPPPASLTALSARYPSRVTLHHLPSPAIWMIEETPPVDDLVRDLGQLWARVS